MRAFELLNDPHERGVRHLNGRLAQVWTSLPGIIQSFNDAEQTVVVQPSIRAVVFDINGQPTNVDLPLLLDCPVQFPAGGGFTLTFPVKDGDECLVVFSARCIDAWWQSGGVQNQAVLRMHDLSDGFALLGFSSLPRVIGAISTSATQLRSNDGSTFVEVGPSEITLQAVTVNINATASATVTTPTFTVNGATVLNGSLSQGMGTNGGEATMEGPVNVNTDVVIDSKSTISHTHVDPQGGTVGPMQG